MKKLFLIPLLTLMCSVMAWGATNVAQIGDTKYTSFNTAFTAAMKTDGQTIVLLANITKASSASNELRTVSVNVTIDGQGLYSLSRAFTVNAGKTLTLKDVTVNNGTKASSSRTITLGNGSKLVLDNAIIAPAVDGVTAVGMAKAASAGTTATIELAEGSTNTINNREGSSTLYTYNYSTSKKNSKLIIAGEGALTVNHTGTSGALFASHTNGGNYTINAANVHFLAENQANLVGAASVVKYNDDADTYVKMQKDTKWELLALNAASMAANNVVATVGGVAYTSLEDAVGAAQTGDVVTLWANAVAVSVAKVVTFEANGYNVDAIAASAGYVKVEEGDVVAIMGVATIDQTHYTSLAAALSAAPKAALITLWADAPATTINQSVVINKNGFNAALTAGTGYVETVEDSYYIYAADASDFAAFLAADGTASYTLTDDIDISLAGTLPVNGTKTLTIPAGKKIFYQRQGSDANILVNEGAKLTILGNGSVEPAQGTEIETSADMFYQMGCWAIRVDGELVVGVEGADQPHFVSTAGRISGVNNFHGAPIYITENGKAIINNIDINAALATFFNAGETTINGGEFISVSSSQSGGLGYSYALQNYGKMVINDIHVQGTHGGFACQNFHTSEDVVNGFAEAANAVINGGTFETVHGKNFITGVDNAKDNYYAMYVSNFGIVNVYGGKFKVQTPSAGSSRVVLIGNNDYYNSYGVINFYGGMYAEKAYVTKKKNAESAFPPSIPSTSAWYSAFEVKDAKNAYAPLPAGYEYYEITEGADYEAGYRFGVRLIPGAKVDEVEVPADPTVTIPWQQETTWSSDAVPEANTVVVIPVGATVVVSKDETNKDAVAEQVIVSQGASLTVETGTSLTVGKGGMNIGHDGQLVVEAGAAVMIGAAGVITANEDALIIESSEDIQGALLYDPAVAENTQPKATVRLTTKCYQKNASYEYQWQRFAIPLISGSAPDDNYTDQALFPGETEFETYLFAWSNAGSSWVQPDGWASLVPHKGYQIANNTKDGGIVYSFTGNLVGNQDGAYPFDVTGFEFFGNSYTAPIYVPELLEGLSAQGQEGIDATVYVYDVDLDQFIIMTPWKLGEKEMYNEDEYKEEIASMQAFIIKGNAGATADMSYEDAIWSNPRFNTSSGAPKRRSSINYDLTLLKVTANGKQDMLALRQRDDFSAEYDNGADAFKYMNEGTFNIYANTEIGDLAEVSTDELNNTILGFQSAEAAEYTLTCSGQKGESFILRDLMTGAEVNLEKGATYTFAQQPNTTNEARFQIVDGRMAPTAVENVQNVKKAEGIYTVLGKYLGAADQLDKLPAGMYIVNGVKIVK